MKLICWLLKHRPPTPMEAYRVYLYVLEAEAEYHSRIKQGI